MPLREQLSRYKNTAKSRILVAVTLVVIFVLAPLALLLGLASMVEAGHQCRDLPHAGAVVRFVCWSTMQPDVHHQVR